jgi:hypothetical protein
MSAAGGAMSGLYNTIAPRVGEAMQQGSAGMMRAMSGAVGEAVRRGDRDAVVAAMQDSMGMSPSQANRAADLALAAAGRGDVSPQAERQAERAADAGATATGWLAGAILLSLIVALVGGALGARGARRFTRLQHRVPAESHTMNRPITAPGEARLS